MRPVVLACGLAIALAVSACAQDVASVDPAHYKVQMENDEVRVLKVHYGPHETSPLHRNRGGALVLLTDAHLKYTMSDGTVRQMKGLRGEVMWPPVGTETVENLSDAAFDGALVQARCAAAKTHK